MSEWWLSALIILWCLCALSEMRAARMEAQETNRLLKEQRDVLFDIASNIQQVEMHTSDTSTSTRAIRKDSGSW